MIPGEDGARERKSGTRPERPVDLRRLLSRRGRASLVGALRDASSLDLQILGRTILHAAIVGLAAGLVGAAFFATLEWGQWFLLEKLAGYESVRAAGDTVLGDRGAGAVFRPWLLVLLPAAGGLLCGLIAHRFAPEAAGGGGDRMIEAFHRDGGKLRRRLLWAKPLTSIATLASGGAGGREGPTMQIGAAIGSAVADLLRIPERERRILMVAGVAAGMSAVFRTPLGAALLAVEVLYRDDFESDALIPAVLASVISYAVAISLYGESTLFATVPHYPFVPSHLLLYGLLAVIVSLLASAFVFTLRSVERLSLRFPGPVWLRPAIGGLALGLLYFPITTEFGALADLPRRGLGIFGSGYGLVQVALTSSPLMPTGWAFARMLGALCILKLVAASFTIGTGGSAGDFAPSLVIGGLAGGAFGEAARLLLGDPAIDPGAFALVGMGAFYGGIAHVPLSALVMVSELAGSYDLLVPLMLAIGVAFVLLRKRTIYHAQLRDKRESPQHRHRMILDALDGVLVETRMETLEDVCVLVGDLPLADIFRRIADAPQQQSFPIVDEGYRLIGLVPRSVAGELGLPPAGATSRDVMRLAVKVRADDNLRSALELLVEHGLRDVPVVDAAGKLIAILDETAIIRAYLEVTETADVTESPR